MLISGVALRKQPMQWLRSRPLRRERGGTATKPTFSQWASGKGLKVNPDLDKR